MTHRPPEYPRIARNADHYEILNGLKHYEIVCDYFFSFLLAL